MTSIDDNQGDVNNVPIGVVAFILAMLLLFNKEKECDTMRRIILIPLLVIVAFLAIGGGNARIPLSYEIVQAFTSLFSPWPALLHFS